MVDLVAQRIPTFSSALLTSTTVPVTQISPGLCSRMICPVFLVSGQKSPASPPRLDPFKKDAADTSAAERDEDNVSPLLHFEPARRVTQINEHLKTARDARLMGRPDTAVTAYREALAGLRQPPSNRSSEPIYSIVNEGQQLLSEALIGATALTSDEIFGTKAVQGTTPARENIEDLSRHVEELKKTHAPKADQARAKALLAFNLIQHASAGKVQHDSLFGKAIKIAEDARSDVDATKGNMEDAEIHFLSSLLILEALARRMDLAHQSRDPQDVEKFADRLTAQFKKIFQDHFEPLSPAGEKEEFVNLFASYNAQIAIIKYKLGLGAHALSRVRSVVSPGTFEKTPAAQVLREHPYFDSFFDNGRLKDAGEVENDAASGAFLRRLQAAFANAHSHGILPSMLTGAGGMVVGLTIAAASGHPEFGWAAGGAGAALAEGGYQLRNGWNSLQARDAARIGTNKISGRETASHVANFAAKRLAAGIMWAVPSSALAMGTDLGETVINTLANVPGGYEKAFWRLVDSPHELFPATNGDPAHIAYQIYTKAAGLVFLSNLLIKRSRALMSKASFFFIPGAVMLSADIGLAIAPPDMFANAVDAWVDRIWRASIVSTEMLFMLLTTGLSPLQNTGLADLKKSFASLGKTLHPTHGNTDYNLPLAAAIVTGISSPLGGMFQVGQAPEAFPLLAAQGATITAGLLGLTIFMSGLLKRQIPIFSRPIRAVKDVHYVRLDEARRVESGETVDHRTSVLAYPYEAVRGGMAAFNCGYVRNRVLRIAGPDMVGSAVRLFAGGGEWDNNAGQTAMSTVNGVSGNPYWDTVYPGASGADPEEQSFIRALDKIIAQRAKVRNNYSGRKLTPEEQRQRSKELEGSLDLLKDFLRKSGQTIHPLHVFLPFQSRADRLWPLYPFTKPILPPEFPQRPNPLLYGSLYEMFAEPHGVKSEGEELEADAENLSAQQFEIVLEFVQKRIADTGSYHVMRPLVKTLLLARKSPRFGKRIEQFVKDNPHIFIMLNINPDKAELQPIEEPLRRKARLQVRDAVRQPLKVYEGRIRRYRRLPVEEKSRTNAPHALDGFFQSEITSPARPADAAQEGAGKAGVEQETGQKKANAKTGTSAPRPVDGFDSIPPRVRV